MVPIMMLALSDHDATGNRAASVSPLALQRKAFCVPGGELERQRLSIFGQARSLCLVAALTRAILAVQ
jgi:hypothetical protein